MKTVIRRAADRTCFHIYGPDKAAFDGSWKPGDFEEVGEGRAVDAPK